MTTTSTQAPARHNEPTSSTSSTTLSASRRHVAVLRIAFGLVWVIDAILKWSPGYRNNFGAMLDGVAKGQPGWLGPWFDLWTGLPHGAATVLAFGSAATETFLAAALLVGFARKSVYLLGLGYSLMVWATGEGFGGPYHAGSTDVGAAIIYAIVFASLLVIDRSGPDPHSIDAYLERRIHWWHWIAEVGSAKRQARSARLPASAPDEGTATVRPRAAMRIAVDVPDDR